MRIFKRVFILLSISILCFRCVSEYDKGEREYNVKNYDEAKAHYMLVEKDNDKYQQAVLRILEIDSIIDKELFDRGKKLFIEKRYSDAEVFLFKIDSTSLFYTLSKLYLNKIDSVKQRNKVEEARQEKLDKIKEEKTTKLKEIENEKLLRQVEQKVRILFNELLAFKDKSDFHYYGFGVGYKYNKWLKEVQALKDAPGADLLMQKGFVVGDLETLGLEYANYKGKETEYSRWAKKTIIDGLNN